MVNENVNKMIYEIYLVPPRPKPAICYHQFHCLWTLYSQVVPYVHVVLCFIVTPHNYHQPLTSHHTYTCTNITERQQHQKGKNGKSLKIVSVADIYIVVFFVYCCFYFLFFVFFLHIMFHGCNKTVFVLLFASFVLLFAGSGHQPVTSHVVFCVES